MVLYALYTNYTAINSHLKTTKNLIQWPRNVAPITNCHFHEIISKVFIPFGTNKSKNILFIEMEPDMQPYSNAH